jgi:hypothetical protein
LISFSGNICFSLHSSSLFSHVFRYAFRVADKGQSIGKVAFRSGLRDSGLENNRPWPINHQLSREEPLRSRIEWKGQTIERKVMAIVT